MYLGAGHIQNVSHCRPCEQPVLGTPVGKALVHKRCAAAKLPSASNVGDLHGSGHLYFIPPQKTNKQKKAPLQQYKRDTETSRELRHNLVEESSER